jgi:hypothetical protein
MASTFKGAFLFTLNYQSQSSHLVNPSPMHSRFSYIQHRLVQDVNSSLETDSLPIDHVILRSVRQMWYKQKLLCNEFNRSIANGNSGWKVFRWSLNSYVDRLRFLPNFVTSIVHFPLGSLRNGRSSPIFATQDLVSLGRLVPCSCLVPLCSFFGRR